ncbi:hypothetical protein GCM10007320_31160 [Pseudorhodoferax aquiterrae]|uniref:Uncharacterized protein n=1 Tax=Pseudorhodoferax aquiterrae TaxID=747304 RepID=A0ABQ3G3M1_9BURK|nr:hypothetical protein [Pseudorhodoferax aquiterrae]GHC85827.1 hypothetical protein GCM10007320_31160 [Pseudorhodoferax aquiterrae]
MDHGAPLALRILQELATAPAEGGMSLPRLGKRLGLGASVLMRELAGMGDAAIGGVRGPGWARVEQLDGRWVAHITPAGRERLSAGPR